MKKTHSMISSPTVRYSKRRRTHKARLGVDSRRRLQSEPLESRAMLAADGLHNTDNPADVDGNGIVTALDALHVINDLNDAGARSLRTGAAPRQVGMFYDVNNDEFLTPVDALLVLNELNAEGEDGDLVQIRLQPTDLDGNAISTIDVGQDFQLRVYVQDLTARSNGGVFAAYVDVEYDAALASTTGAIVASDTYNNGKSGSIATAGLIDEAGALDGLSPLGANEFLLFTVPMQADAAGSVTFTSNEADIRPAHDVLVYGTPAGETGSVVSPDRIAYLTASLQIGSVAAPTAVNDSYTTAESQTLSVNVATGVLANDTNPGTDTLVAAAVGQPTHGALTLNANGSFEYIPEAGFTGTDSFTYRASAGDVSSNTATVTITVTGVNTAPVGAADSYSVNEDATLTSTTSVLANDTDADDDTLTASLVTGPSNGTLTLQPNGQFIYKPAANFNGTDTFVYRANDGTVNSANTTVTITVLPVNDAPVAGGDSYSTSADTQLIVTVTSGVLTNDTDVDGNSLTAVVLSDPDNGTVTLNNNGSFTYVPAAGFSGTDSFVYAANDGTTNSAAATVTITVTAVSTEKQVRVRLETTNLDGTPVTSIGVGGSFLLKGYVRDISSAPQDGVFAAYLDVLYESDLVSIDGAITYGPSYPNQHAGSTDTAGLIDEVGAFDGLTPLGSGEFLLFSVPMVASQGGTADFATDGPELRPAHDILLYNSNTPVNDADIDFGTATLAIVSGGAPVGVADSYTTSEDTVLTVNAPGVLSNDSDPDSDPLTAVLVTGPAQGSVTLNANGSFVYTPRANYNGTDTFTYRANDGSATSAATVVSIVVNPVDDAPIAVNDSYQLDNGLPLVVSTATGVLANDADVDGDTLTSILVDSTKNGTIVLNADGSFTYTPATGFVGLDSFTYRAVANGVQSSIATVTLNVGNLTPSTIGGFVYSDADNDGVMDAGEARYGGIEVTLRGADLLGRAVSRTTHTAANGSYEFAEVLSGDYTVTEFQPRFLVDGKDTHNGQLSLRNDRFIIELGAGVSESGYNFGERGLQPQYILNPMFFSSRTTHGLLAAYDGAGEMVWYCVDTGWSNLVAVDSTLTPGTGLAEVSIADSNGAADTSSVLITGNRNVRLTGNATDGYLFKMSGDPSDFGLVPVDGGEGELDVDAVDAAFGGKDA